MTSGRVNDVINVINVINIISIGRYPDKGEKNVQTLAKLAENAPGGSQNAKRNSVSAYRPPHSGSASLERGCYSRDRMTPPKKARRSYNCRSARVGVGVGVFSSGGSPKWWRRGRRASLQMAQSAAPQTSQLHWRTEASKARSAFAVPMPQAV